MRSTECPSSSLFTLLANTTAVQLFGARILWKTLLHWRGLQRRFTKRLPGIKSLTYHQRLTKLDLESLELRRIRADLIFAYKLIFDLTDINPSEFFAVRVDDARRRRRYRLYLPGPGCKSAARYNSFISYRVVRVWNTITAGKINFQSINSFRASLTNSLLIYQCKLSSRKCVLICIYK